MYNFAESSRLALAAGAAIEVADAPRWENGQGSYSGSGDTGAYVAGGARVQPCASRGDSAQPGNLRELAAAGVDTQALRVLRANRGLHADEKHIRMKTTVIVENR